MIILNTQCHASVFITAKTMKVCHLTLQSNIYFLLKTIPLFCNKGPITCPHFGEITNADRVS